MSAIAGIVAPEGSLPAVEVIERMTAAMASRGPDGISHWRSREASLGHNMLRSTPEAVETQPLASNDGQRVLVMDGVVDNRQELTRELRGRGARLRDGSDAELVLGAFEAWGEESPRRIIGEYVFIVWDARERRLFGARDAVGARHFYFHVSGERIAFASEIRGLLACDGIAARLNDSRLLDFLVQEFDREDERGTFYAGIERLPAGHAMRFDARGLATWRHWDLSGLPEARFSSLDECGEALREQLKAAVECRLRSRRPVGAQLSGGLDSSAVVALARQQCRGGVSSPLRTFTLVLPDRERCPEWRAASAIVAQGGLDASFLSPAEARPFLAAYLQRVAALGEPFDFYAMPNALLYQAAADKGCGVMLDGMAGDLLFYGYGRSARPRLRTARMLPKVLQAGMRHRFEGSVGSFARQVVFGLIPEVVREPMRRLRDVYGPLRGEIEVIRPELARRFRAARRAAQRARDAAGSRNLVAEHAHDFMAGTLAFAHEVNSQIALNLGVEPRSPMSDQRVIEFAVSMPVEAKLCAGWYKGLLRRTMVGILPPEVAWRRQVEGHPGWAFYTALCEEASRDARLWSRSFVEGKLGTWLHVDAFRRAQQRYAARSDYESGLRVLSLGVLARWLETRFDGRA